jgi:hypothetical protein
MAHPESSRRRVKASVNRARQERAMIEQFSGEDSAESERRGWQLIRRAAVARNLKT